jgi:hypothetical protein
MGSPKIELNVSEENEIGFKLKIEGSANDIGSAKPRIRFALTEKLSGRGWLFTTSKTDDDGISVTIPSMKGMVKENQEYAGKLEVILGEHYFTPTEMDINFVEPLKVEATIVTTSKTAKPLKEETEQQQTPATEEAHQQLVVESQMIASVIKKPVPKKEEPIVAVAVVPEVIKEVKTRKRSYSDLDADDKQKVNGIFVNKCKKIDPENFKSKRDVAHYMKEGTDYTKKRMSALMAQSIKQYLEENS